jgi:hypothetical protein
MNKFTKWSALAIGLVVIALSATGCASAPYKVSAPNIVVGAKIGDPAVVKTAIIGPVMQERTLPLTFGMGNTIYNGKLAGSRRDFILLQEQKAQSYGAAFAAEFSKRFGSAPVILTTNLRKTDPDNFTVEVYVGNQGDLDLAFVREAAELSKKAGTEQFVVISGRVLVDDVNTFGTSASATLRMYSILYDNTGKQLKEVLLMGPTVKKLDSDDTADYASVIEKGQAAIPEIFDKLFGKK